MWHLSKSERHQLFPEESVSWLVIMVPVMHTCMDDVAVEKLWVYMCLFRLVPNLVALILFCTFILPWIGTGPLWNQVVRHHSDICKNTWWRNLLFIHNYFGFESMVSFIVKQSCELILKLSENAIFYFAFLGFWTFLSSDMN